MYKTSDGGTTWRIVDSVSRGGQTMGISSHDTVVYATWTGGIPPYSSGIRRTSDGGATWHTVDSLLFYYTEFQFIAPSIGFAAGGIPNLGFTQFAPSVRRTSDGGSSWQTAWSGAYPYELESISFVDSSYGWAITYNGLVYRSTNSGYNWIFQDSLFADLPFRDIQFTTRDSGWAVGGIAGAMRFARTTDGGANWSYTTVGGPSLWDIQMLNSRMGWAVGLNSSSVHRTDDGGETWQQQTVIPPAPIGFYSICMIDEQLGWTVSSFSVYKTTNGGVVAVDQDTEKPTRYLLGQNYPNPFNPTTTITFALAERAFVSIKVFDVLGREAATVVNEVKDAGDHSVQFDASNLSSGVYLCRLQSHDFIEVNKLVLLR